MAESYRTPYDDKPFQPHSNKRLYATTAIIVSGVLVGGTAAASYASSRLTNQGLPFTHNGQQYYVPKDSKRAVYPDQQACMQDVPLERQSECEPRSNYHGGGGGLWYGPVFHSRDRYQPNSRYPTELASSSNIGKRLPSGANSDGFGANGKAFTGSKGG